MWGRLIWWFDLIVQGGAEPRRRDRLAKDDYMNEYTCTLCLFLNFEEISRVLQIHLETGFAEIQYFNDIGRQ